MSSKTRINNNAKLDNHMKEWIVNNKSEDSVYN